MHTPTINKLGRIAKVTGGMMSAAALALTFSAGSASAQDNSETIEWFTLCNDIAHTRNSPAEEITA